MPSLESRDPKLEPKDPDDDKQYAVHLLDKLPSRPTAATLVSASVVTITPTGMTADTPVVTGAYAVFMTHDGTADVDYVVTLRMLLSNSESWDVHVTIPCRVR